MSEEKSGDEVSLLELYVVAMRYKWWILASSLVSGILAFLYVSLALHPAWEASAILEVGKIERGKGKVLVEPPLNVVARMQQASFNMGVLKEAGFKSDDLTPDANRFVGSLKASVVKDTELVEVSVRAPARDMAFNQLKASVAYLQKVHLGMMESSIEAQKNGLEQVVRDIQSEKLEMELLRKKLLSAHDWNAFDATMVAIVLKDRSAELNGMMDKKLQIEEQMGAQNTFTTRVVGDVAVSDGPVWPKKPLMIGLAMMLGLFGGLIAAFAYNAITSQKSL